MKLQRGPYAQQPAIQYFWHNLVLYLLWRTTSFLSSCFPWANWHKSPYRQVPFSLKLRQISVLNLGLAVVLTMLMSWAWVKLFWPNICWSTTWLGWSSIMSSFAASWWLRSKSQVQEGSFTSVSHNGDSTFSDDQAGGDSILSSQSEELAIVGHGREGPLLHLGLGPQPPAGRKAAHDCRPADVRPEQLHLRPGHEHG